MKTVIHKMDEKFSSFSNLSKRYVIRQMKMYSKVVDDGIVDHLRKLPHYILQSRDPLKCTGTELMNEIQTECFRKGERLQ